MKVSASASEHALPLAADERQLGDGLYDWLTRFASPLLFALLATVGVAAATLSAHKRLWYDEMFTLLVATRPSWHSFLQAMPAEGNPPLNTMLTAASIRLFGISALAIRLPDLLGFLVAVALVYVFVRREVGPALGLVAAVLVVAEPAWTYSFEARPYGVLLACLMLALVSWQAAIRPPAAESTHARALPLLGLAAGIVGCIFAHHIGVVEVGVPLIFGEAVRTYRTRHIDWPLWATGLVALPCVALLIPMIRHTHDAVIVYAQVWRPPMTFAKLRGYFNWARVSWPSVMSNDLLLVMTLAVLVNLSPRMFRANRTRSRAPESVASVSPAILAAALGAALLVPFTWTALLAAHGWYFCRYGVGTVVGTSLLCCLLLGSRTAAPKVVASFLALYALLCFFGGFLDHRRMLNSTQHTDDIVYTVPSDKPVVLADPYSFPTLWWYALPPLKQQLVYLPYATAAMPDLKLLEATLLAERPALGSAVQNYESFLHMHHHFTVVVNPFSKPFRQDLERDGCTLTPLRTNGVYELYDTNCSMDAESRDTRSQ